MEILNALAKRGEPIAEFDSRAAEALKLAEGRGESHLYVIRFDAGGEIGPHPAGFDQIFLVIDGEGWAADPEGLRRTIRRGEAARFNRGEVHSKGSDTGMTALMIQIDRLVTE